MVTKLADNYIIEPSETISTCLLLADFYIDDKGNDATKPNWITCTVEDRLRER